MFRPLNSLLVLISFLALLCVVSPSWAQTQLSDCAGNDPTNGGISTSMGNAGMWQNSYINALTTSGQQHAQNHVAGIAGTPPIDVQMNYCLQKLFNLFQSVISASDLSGITNLIFAAIMPMIVGILNNLCTQVVSTISALEQNILNSLSVCIPLPSFNLNLKMNGVKMTQHPCNGINFKPFTLKPAVGQMAPGQFGTPNLYQLLLNQQQ